MAIRCEHCGKLSPDASVRCECGYDFATGELGLAIDVAQRDLGAAQRRIGQGIAAFAALVLVLLVAGVLVTPLGPALASLVVAAVAVPCAIAGAVGVVKGVGGGVAASRRLRAAEARKKLPVARVVE